MKLLGDLSATTKLLAEIDGLSSFKTPQPCSIHYACALLIAFSFQPPKKSIKYFMTKVKSCY